MPDLHIACLLPGGMNRGGKRHEGLKAHNLDDFTEAQLREIIAEPHLAAIVGGDVLSDKHLAMFKSPEAVAAAKKAKA